MKAIFADIVLLICVAMFAQQAAAIPAFARKYDMSCNTCHAPIPRMKPYGNDFAGNGFQLEGKEPARYFKDTGDEWLQLMRDLPLAIRLEGFANWQPQGTGKTDFQAPWLLKILSGGQIATDISYYFYFFFSEQGEVAGIEDAYLYFNNVGGVDFDILVGQFQVSDPLFKRELRLTRDDYTAFTLRPGASGIDLTYDRGVVLSLGLPGGTGLFLQALNGSGIGPLEQGAFDRDVYKNLMLRVSQEVGEAFRIGGFGYLGKEKAPGSPTDEVNGLWMVGVDATMGSSTFELNVQYLERRDDNPLFVASEPEKAATRGAFAELIYTPLAGESRWYGVLLWNWGESDVQLQDLGRKYQTGTGHVGYLLARNLRLTAEYTYDFIGKANTVSLGFVSAF
jgi:hypothetical protein